MLLLLILLSKPASQSAALFNFGGALHLVEPAPDSGAPLLMPSLRFKGIVPVLHV
jgi:hypothetical protein